MGAAEWPKWWPIVVGGGGGGGGPGPPVKNKLSYCEIFLCGPVVDPVACDICEDVVELCPSLLRRRSALKVFLGSAGGTSLLVLLLLSSIWN